MTKVYLNVKTQSLWETILDVINFDSSDNYRWGGGQEPHEGYSYWKIYKEKTVLQIDTTLEQLMYGDMKYHEPLGHFIQNYDGDWLRNKALAESKEYEKEGKSMPTNKIYVQVKTQGEYDLFMHMLEDEGYTWASGDSPSTLDYWDTNEENTIIAINKKNKKLSISSVSLETDNGKEVVVYRGYTKHILNGEEQPESPYRKSEERELPNDDSKIRVPKVVYDYLKEKGVDEDGEPNRDDDFLIYTLARDYSTGDLETENKKLYRWFSDNDSIFKLVDAIRNGYYTKEKESLYYLKLDSLGYVMDYTTQSDGDKTIDFAKKLVFATKYSMKTIEQDLPDFKQYTIEVPSND